MKEPVELRWRWIAAAALFASWACLASASSIHPGCECVEFTSTFGQPYGQFTSPDFPKPYDPGIGCVLYTFSAPQFRGRAPSAGAGASTGRVLPSSSASTWIVELTITHLNLPPTQTCGDGDHLALYLHLDRAEVNEHTRSNGRVCSLPGHPGRKEGSPVRYYSAMSHLVVAFHAAPAPANSSQPPDSARPASGQRDTSLQRPTNEPYGFKGTYRFIRKSQFRSDGQRIAGSACDYQFISGNQHGSTGGGQQLAAPASVATGGNQMVRRGRFYSPLYPSLYPSNSRCFYHFYGRTQERVKIHFGKLILGDEDVSCLSSEDGIKVYDGGDVHSPVIAHLCGVSHHAELWSSSSSLLIEFYSSNASEHTFEGFEARYQFLPAVEHADDDEIEEDEEEDEERDGSRGSDDEDYDVPLRSLAPAVTSVRPTSTSRPTSAAAAAARPSPTTTRRPTQPPTTRTTTTTARPKSTTTTARKVQTTRLASTTAPTTTMSPAPSRLVTASSRKTTPSIITTIAPTTQLPSTVNDSLSYSYEANNGSACDRVFRSDTEKNGTFTSPGYPSTYTPSLNCNYEFRGHGRERVQIIFTDFVLHHPHDDPSEKPFHPWLRQSCDGADRVTAYISVGGNKEKIDDFCGSGTPRELMSNSATMSLHFHSTAVSRGARGFKARYAFVSNFGITTGEQISSMPCAFRYNSSASSNGTFWSPNFPGFYPRDTECHYFFHAQVGERVKIVFSYFDIEGMVPCGQTSASDFVEVSNFMTVDRKLPRYCGQLKDLKMESDGSFFRVTFKSNDRFDGTGFFASYQFTPVADAVTITRRRSSSPAAATSYPAGCLVMFCVLAYLAS